MKNMDLVTLSLSGHITEHHIDKDFIQSPRSPLTELLSSQLAEVSQKLTLFGPEFNRAFVLYVRNHKIYQDSWS